MQYKRKLKRYILAAVMLVLATYATLFIKDTVDAMNPEKSLPIISVSIGYNPPAVVRAGYTWNFGLKTVRAPYLSAADVPLMTTDCYPGEHIAVDFSAPYDFITLYMTEGLANDDFRQVYNMQTPMEEGVYVFKLVANFKEGDIVYYFAVNVKTQNLQP